MIELSDIRYQYPASEFSLEIASFRARAGEAVALVGPSGCGKTTLLQIAAGIITPDAGAVRIAGESIEGWSQQRRAALRLQKIGLVFQEFELVEHLSVRENILLPRYLGRMGASLEERLGELAKLTGMADHLAKYPQKLSQGERQRVAICRALIIRPQILLADEPTGNLDPTNKRKALDLLIRHSRESQCPLLVATHDHDLLPGFDRVVDFSTLNSKTQA